MLRLQCAQSRALPRLATAAICLLLLVPAASAGHRQAVAIPSGSDFTVGTLGVKRVDPRSSGVVSLQSLKRKAPRQAVKEYRLSLKEMSKGAIPDAAVHLRNALAEDPDYMEAHNELGVCYAAQKQMEKAVGEFQRAAELDPGSASAFYNLSVAFFALGRNAEAESAVRRSLKLNPAHDEARYLLGLSLHEQHQDGKETLEVLRRVAGQYPKARLTIARILADRGLSTEAAGELKRFLDSPDDAVDRHAVESWLAALESRSSTQASNQEVQMPATHQ
jgi:tetratricopeptide (TPR) repeat protein